MGGHMAPPVRKCRISQNWLWPDAVTITITITLTIIVTVTVTVTITVTVTVMVTIIIAVAVAVTVTITIVVTVAVDANTLMSYDLCSYNLFVDDIQQHVILDDSSADFPEIAKLS